MVKRHDHAPCAKEQESFEKGVYKKMECRGGDRAGTDCEYHIFGNGWDEYTSDVEEVFQILQEQLIEDPTQAVRIYRNDIWNAEEGIFENDNCVFSLGNYPL